MSGEPVLYLSRDLLSDSEDDCPTVIDDVNDLGKAFRQSGTEPGTIHYMSDLHLDNKLAKLYGLTPTYSEVDSFIVSVIDELKGSLSDSDRGHIMIFDGDTADNFQLNRMFFTKVRETFPDYTIIVTLGNHELWGYGCSGVTVDEIVEEYRKMFNSIGIILLHNDLYVFDGARGKIVDEGTIQLTTDDELAGIADSCEFSILGGTGFSGFDPVYNATLGLYRDKIMTKEEDRRYSLRFLEVYDRIICAFKEGGLVVVTHCPKRQWSPDGRLDRCLYISGHSHINSVTIENDRAEFSDNQVGGYGNNYRFKTLNPRYCGKGSQFLYRQEQNDIP